MQSVVNVGQSQCNLLLTSGKVNAICCLRRVKSMQYAVFAMFTNSFGLILTILTKHLLLSGVFFFITQMWYYESSDSFSVLNSFKFWT